MEKKESTKSTVTILKTKSYADHKIVLPLDAQRTEKFNKGEKIEVSEEELTLIKSTGNCRWLEVKIG